MENEVLINVDTLKNALTSAMYEFWKNTNKVENNVEVPKDDKVKFIKLLHALKHKDYAVAKALAPNVESTDSAGGYLVPRETQDKILDVVGTYGQARNLFSKIPISQSGKMAIPKYGGGVTAYWVGENAQISDSAATFNVLNVDSKKLAAIVAVSNELLEDQNVDLADFIVQKIAEAFGIKEDQAFFNGSSPFTGLFQTSASSFGNAVDLGGDASNLTYEMIMDMVYGIDQKHLVGAKWLMHRTWLSAIRKLKDQNGNPIFYPANDGSVGTLVGYPIELVEAAPTSSATANGVPYIILGNPSNTFWGQKRELTVQVLTEATIDGVNLAEYDLTAIKVTERVAFHAGLTEKYSCLYSTV